MSLAIGWDTPDGVPTTPSFIVLGAVLTALTIGVMLVVRRRDRKRLLAERLPYARLVAKTGEMAEQNQQMLERHERIIRQRGQWLADQVTEHGEHLRAVENAVGDIRGYVVQAYGENSRPHLTVVKDG